MTKKTLATLLVTGLITTLATGCSGGEDYLFEHGPAGPDTKRTLETLPEGLLPDQDKASHTAESHHPSAD